MRLIITIICILFQYCAEKEILPQKIQGYDLAKIISGAEAQKMVNRIHLQAVTNTENEIGFYEKSTDQAIIYVTHYQTDDGAQKDLIKMVDKISPENSVFINGGKVEINKMIAYRYFGIGQTHFIFRNNQMLFWLSVNTLVAQEFLESYIEYLQKYYQ